MSPRSSGHGSGGSPERSPRAPIRLEAAGLTKRFGDFTANDSVDLRLRRGEVHVLLGENGAGKSTFMNMLYGHLRPDEGSIAVDDREVGIASPADALSLGIGMVHQHFALAPSLTVAQNVVLGSETQRFGFSPSRISSEVRATVDRLGWDFDVDRRVADLPVSAQQRVEILKLLHRGAEILLLDEPTALLSPVEIDDLLTVLSDLRDAGCSLLLVTHKLKEVEQLADVVTVIRHGSVTGEFGASEIDAASIASAMTGRAEIPEIRTTGTVSEGAPQVLTVDGLTVRGQGADVVSDVDIAVRAGEIVGIAAVEGNGQHELIQAIAGVVPAHSGTVVVEGQDVTGAPPLARRLAGMSVIPADRREEGVVGDMSLTENFALNSVAAGLRRTRWGLLDWRAMREDVSAAVAAYDVRPGNIRARASSLSGGNMQKLVIARELHSGPRVVLAVSPTWGLDVGAVSDVQARIAALRDQGVGVLLSSPDLDELVGLSDRIVVLYRGRVVKEFTRENLDMSALSLALMGDVAERPAA